MPSSVSSLPSEGNFPPTVRPFEEVGAAPALDLAATDFFAAVFFTEVESGALSLAAAAEAEGALLVETIGEERDDEGRAAAAAATEGVRRAARANIVEF